MADDAKVYALNMALFVLGQEPVADLSEPALRQSAAAVKILRVFDMARDTVLRRHGWTCALQYSALEPTTIAGLEDWRYPTAFLLPGDALRVWEVDGALADRAIGSSGCVRWQIGTFEPEAGGAQLFIRAGAGQTDLAALTSVDVAYVRRVGWGALDAHVLDAIAYDAAARSVRSVTGKEDAKKWEQAEARVHLAISVDATQEGGQPAWGGSIPAAIRAGAR